MPKKNNPEIEPGTESEEVKPRKKNKNPILDPTFYTPPMKPAEVQAKAKKKKKAEKLELQKNAVSVMVMAGIPVSSQAKILGVSIQTMHKKFQDELDHGGHVIVSKVANSMLKKALEGDTKAGIFILKSKGGFVEKNHLDITATNSIEGMSATERQQRLARIMLQGKFKDKVLDVKST
jgi:hypothetical protein